MHVTEICDEAGFLGLEKEWQRLLSESHSPRIFLTPEWGQAWWSAYGTPGELRVLTVRDEVGVLRGIAPLRTQKVKRYGNVTQALSLVGDGSIGSHLNDSDYLDFVAGSGCEKRVAEAVYGHLMPFLSRGGALLLNEVPATSPNLAAFKAIASCRTEWQESDVPCATVALPSSWDEYLRMLQPRFRTKVRSVLREFESRADVTFHFCEKASQLDRVLSALFELHGRRWAKVGKPGVFGWERKRDFYDQLSRKLLTRGWLRFCWLEWRGKILACQYGFAYGGTYSHLQEGYEPAAEHWKLGIALRAWSMRRFIEAGLGEYDFLGGVNRHKTDWGATVKTSKRIMCAGRAYNNLMFRRGEEWERNARALIRRFLPARIVDAGRALVCRNEPPVSGALRDALAKCYLYTGMPFVTRRLRSRYELSAGLSHGLARRRHGGARILYYHRVNDDNDPSSAALPLHEFERHLRHLSRHYRIASLSEIVAHLEDNSCRENLIGITFDDGYQDNYHNAFPILRRYGAPATIFLATGCIDSREPLWFDQLANAVRRTEKTYIDLEIDLPRRLWMRTEQERLDSNRALFETLRVLDDENRRGCLADILRRLAVGVDRRPDMMLTWDQVRLMAANGIEFGGHTVSHPFLSKVSPARALVEVSECKTRIEQELQKEVHYFAYPNGREKDFSPVNKDLVRKAGYRAAVTTIWGMNYQTTDRMELRRGGPWEGSSAMFAMKMDWYTLTNR